MAALLLLILSILFGFSVQQQDPLKDFCRRFGHQTALIDQRLFIDGGLLNYNPLNQNPLNYTNTGLLYADIDVDNDGMPMEYDNLTKPASAPDVSGGILWADTVNKMLYLYGGEFYQSSPESFSLWSYDAIYGNWTTVNPDPTQANIQRSSFGAGLVAEDIAKGFWYGGWLSNATIPTWGANPIALSNFLEYDLIHNTWTNSSGPDSIGRAEGVMVYIPASDGGMLVYFGGLQDLYGNGSSIVAQPMNQIILYDIAGQRWYTQNATGDIPDNRRRFCAGATWAKDQSSYNIYLYGGFSVPSEGGPGFDDVYILTLPTFTWIKWWPSNSSGTAYPHHSLTCNVISGAQMLVMGGTFPNSSQCDDASHFGFHNLDLGKQNPQGAMWYLFRSNITTYQVPTEIISVVGGSGTGGATAKTPQSGFAESDLSVYFTRTYHPLSRTATRVIPATGTSTANTTSNTVSTGAIVGASVGGAIFLLAIVGIGVALCCVIRRRRRAPPHIYVDEPKPPYLQHPGFMTPVAQLPGSEIEQAGVVELSSPEGEAVAAKLASFSGSPVAHTSSSSSPIAPHLPLYPSGGVYPGHLPYDRGSPPAQWPQPFPAPHGYSPMAEQFPPSARSPSTEYRNYSR